VREWIASLLLAACGGGEPDCRIETVIAQRVGMTAVTDCGSVAVTAGDPDFQAAHDCMTAAIAASEPFIVVWEIQGLDGQAAGAYLGLADPDFTTYALSFHADGHGHHTNTTTERCARLVDLGDCGFLHSSLCMACTQGHPEDACPTK
jgi:hypothetical protein